MYRHSSIARQEKQTGYCNGELRHSSDNARQVRPNPSADALIIPRRCPNGRRTSHAAAAPPTCCRSGSDTDGRSHRPAVARPPSAKATTAGCADRADSASSTEASWTRAWASRRVERCHRDPATRAWMVKVPSGLPRRHTAVQRLAEGGKDAPIRGITSNLLDRNTELARHRLIGGLRIHDADDCIARTRAYTASTPMLPAN